MINILLDTLDFSADFLYEQLKRYIHPGDKVAVFGFSFLAQGGRWRADRNGAFYKKKGDI